VLWRASLPHATSVLQQTYPCALVVRWAAHLRVATRWDDAAFTSPSSAASAEPAAPEGSAAGSAVSAGAVEDPPHSSTATSAPVTIPAPFLAVPYRRHFSSSAVACAVEDLWPLILRLFTVVLRVHVQPVGRAPPVPSLGAVPGSAPVAAPAAPSSRGSIVGGRHGMMSLFGLGSGGGGAGAAGGGGGAPHTSTGRPGPTTPTSDHHYSHEPLLAAALEPAPAAETELRLSALDTLKHALTACLFLGLLRQLQEGADALLQVRGSVMHASALASYLTAAPRAPPPSFVQVEAALAGQEAARHSKTSAGEGWYAIVAAFLHKSKQPSFKQHAEAEVCASAALATVSVLLIISGE
jgi:hypothetical protein